MPYRRISSTAAALACAMVVAACGSEESSTPVSQQTRARLSKTPFGKTATGETVDVITLRTPPGGHQVEMRVMTYGGIILSLQTPDRAGVMDDVVLGFDTLDDYLVPGKSPYFGCLIGRYCNRIARGRFTLDGKHYALATNNDPNHLHGGNKGWDKVVWRAAEFQDTRGVGVVLSHESPAGDEGYPGTVRANVTYTLADNGDFTVDYEATTDAPTVINLTQHSYFNLGGTKTSDILGHELMIPANRYTPVDKTLIPTGELAPVDGTPFDFRAPTTIGARINGTHEQLVFGLGYDHNWVLNRTGTGLEPAARVVEPTTGRTLEISTTEPGLQFYAGNFLPKDGSLTGKGGRTYAYRSGFCLETQHFPDSPNQPAFPSTVLRPGETYRSRTAFRFGVTK